MEPNALGGMIFTLLLAMLVGGFVLLYPLTRRLGALLEARVQEKKQPPQRVADADLDRLREAVAQLNTDVQRLMDRQDFMEKLLAQRADPRPLGAADPATSAGAERLPTPR